MLGSMARSLFVVMAVLGLPLLLLTLLLGMTSPESQRMAMLYVLGAVWGGYVCYRAGKRSRPRF